MTYFQKNMFGAYLQFKSVDESIYVLKMQLSLFGGKIYIHKYVYMIKIMKHNNKIIHNTYDTIQLI